jgi:thioredoxin 1
MGVSNTVIELTAATFDEMVTVSDVAVVVEFWAPWCPPCKIMAPVLDAMANDDIDRVRVAKVNADEQIDLARRYEVVSVPTFLVFVDSELRRRMVGARSRATLLSEVEEVSGSLSPSL